jgi:hypothetical protein
MDKGNINIGGRVHTWSREGSGVDFASNVVILMSYVLTNGHMYGAYLQYVSRPVTFNNIMVTW